MSLERAAAGVVITFIGADLVATEAQNWRQGKNIEKIRLAIGIIGVVGGLYELMNQAIYVASQIEHCGPRGLDGRFNCKLLKEEVEKKCAEVLKQGTRTVQGEEIPPLDLEKHVEDIGANFEHGVDSTGCWTRLTAEGKKFFREKVYFHLKPHYDAFIESGSWDHRITRSRLRIKGSIQGVFWGWKKSSSE